MTLVFRQINAIKEKRGENIHYDDNPDDGQKPKKSASLELLALYIDVFAHNVPIYHLRLNKTKRVA